MGNGTRLEGRYLNAYRKDGLWNSGHEAVFRDHSAKRATFTQSGTNYLIS